MSPVKKILVLDGIGGIPMAREICETLEELGIPTRRIDCLRERRRPLHGLRSAWAKFSNGRAEEGTFYCLPRLDEERLRQRIEEENPSHILVIGFVYKFYDPRRLRCLADAAGARLVLYDTDTCNLYGRRREFIFFVENELPAYHRILSSSEVTTRFFRASLSLDAIFVPFGARPIEVARAQTAIEVLFVGSGDLRRVFLLERISHRVSVRGNRWRRHFPLMSAALRDRVDDRPVWGEELHRLLAQSRIVLNITRSDFYGAETGLNLRIFEALAAGCFLLTDHCDELEELFVVGEEIETFRSSAELAEKVAYYLSHEEERQRIAQRGHERFLRDHTWRLRIEKDLLPHLGERP